MSNEQLVHIEKSLVRKQLILVSMTRQINGLRGVRNAVHSGDYHFLKMQYNSVLREVRELQEKRSYYRNAA